MRPAEQLDLLFDGDVEIFKYPHLTGCGFAFAIAGDGHELDEGVAFNGAGQIRKEEAGALEDADQVEGSRGIVAINFSAQFENALLDFSFGEERT